MSTYSVYNIHIDNNLSFTPGPTAGNVLAIDANGSTSWIPQTGGSGGSGTSGTSGTSGSSGVNGNSSFSWNYTTISSPPTAGYFRTYFPFNQIAINKVSANGDDLSVLIEQWQIGTILSLFKQDGSLAYTFQTTALPVINNPSSPNHYLVVFDIIYTGSSLVNNEKINYIIYTSGDGSSGTSGTSGTSGINGNDGTSGTSGVSGSSEGSFGITIDGGGSAITTGVKGYIQVPYSGTITGWTLLSDISGSIVIDVWKDTFATFPPSVADTIAGSEKPTLSSSQKNQDNSLSTWTTSVTAGDIVGFNVDSASTLTRVNLAIKITKS